MGVGAGLLGVVLGVAAAGGSTTKEKTQTVVRNQTITQTETQTRTRTVRLPPRTRTVTVPAAPSPSSGGGGASASYSGNGGKNLGTIQVPADSDLKWTNDGGIFQIFDDENAVEVNSQGSSGTTVLPAGTYHHFQVNAAGNWTIKIVPK